VWQTSNLTGHSTPKFPTPRNRKRLNLNLKRECSHVHCCSWVRCNGWRKISLSGCLPALLSVRKKLKATDKLRQNIVRTVFTQGVNTILAIWYNRRWSKIQSCLLSATNGKKDSCICTRFRKECLKSLLLAMQQH